jgi:hypothetical protein
MISAAKLKYLTNIDADEMTELLLDAGYDDSDKPIITTYFAGVEVGADNLNFSYQAQYVHVDSGLQFADIIVSFDPVTSAVSADFQS